MPVWFDITGTVVLLIALVGICVLIVGLFMDSETVCNLGFGLVAFPLLGFLFFCVVIIILSALGVPIT